jgi:hypothetical protein
MPEGSAPRKMAPGSLANLRPIQPGTSGNPGGRPKQDANLAKAAREYTIEALNVAVEIMRDPDVKPSTRLSAVDLILSRGHGRAPVTVQVGDSSDQLDAFRETLLEAVQHASSGLSSVTVIDQQATEVVVIQQPPAAPAGGSLLPKDITPKK